MEKPILLTPAHSHDQRMRLARLRRGGTRIVDTYADQLAELFVIEHPELIRLPKVQMGTAIRNHVMQANRTDPLELRGTWAYLPWQKTLSHLLPEKDFFRVRTNRNGNIIPPGEQKKFYDCVVGIAGLSVGGSIALAIVLEGGARTIRIADFDALELSNTNRILAGVHELAVPKTTVIARRIWEMNPYARIRIFPDGLTERNADRFVRGLDVVVDEMDAMAVKQRIRECARRHKVALVSTADNGDSSEVDVERHDLRRTPFFLGRLGKTSVAGFEAMNKLETIRTITRLLGPENVPPRMQESLPEIGRTLVSVPQLGGTAMMGGTVTAFCVRRIAAGLPLPSGRAIVSLDDALVPGYTGAKAKAARDRETAAFAKRYGL